MSCYERVSLMLISIGLIIQVGAFSLQVDQYLYHKSQTSFVPSAESQIRTQ